MMFLILSVQLLPLAAALLVLLVPRKKPNLAGLIALVAALTEFFLVLSYANSGAYYSYPSLFGVNLSFSLDKLASIALMVVSAATAVSVLYSLKLSSEPGRSPSFYSLILLVLFGTAGVALASDLIQFYVAWEAMLIPAWILVVYWNENPEKAKYVGLKFFIITHIGAVLMLASILWIYSITGTTNMHALVTLLPAIPAKMIIIIAALFMMGFIVKLAIFPFHTWLPDAYTTSTMTVTLILVGVMTNIGIYGFARFFPFFPPAASDFLSRKLMIMAVFTMFYGGIMALVEKNAKRIVAYSSMSQMGYVLFGFAAMMPHGFAGSVFNMFNQAATKLALFISLGMVFEHAGTYNVNELGGWAKRLPFAAMCATIAALSLVGAPPLAGFWPEFLTFSAGFMYGSTRLTLLALIASVISAAYALRLIKMVFFGPLREEGETVTSRPVSYIALGVSVSMLILLGIYPSLGFNIVRQAISSLGFVLGG